MLELFRFLSGYSMLKSCISYLDCHIHYLGTDGGVVVTPKLCILYIERVLTLHGLYKVCPF